MTQWSFKKKVPLISGDFLKEGHSKEVKHAQT